MIKLLIWCCLQSALGVGGTGMLNIALHGQEFGWRTVIPSLGTWQGAMGVVLLFASFVVTGYIMSFASLQKFIPVNTAATFLCTAFFAAVFQQQHVPFTTLLGMAVIGIGVAIIAR
jgi:drug/metabolite transporter (DMT)-like permease